MSDNLLLDWALWYARRGWAVFPVLPSKRPAIPGHRADDCDRTDRRCREGHTGWEQRATCDPGRITRAWTARAWGIGIACGPSQLLVLDTDVPTDGTTPGETALARLAVDRALPATWTVSTPSGGKHRYFVRPDGADLGNTAGRLGSHIDTRGAGGYVVAPPTPGPSRSGYRVTCRTRPAPLPRWLVDLLRTPRPAPLPDLPSSGTLTNGYVRAAVEGEAVKVAGALPGSRNHALFCAAVALGQIAATGALHPDAATSHLLRACAGHVAAGAFTEAQAHATIRSGLRTGATTPRTSRAA